MLGFIDGGTGRFPELFCTSCSVDKVESSVAKKTTEVRRQKGRRRMLETQMIADCNLCWELQAAL